MQSFCRCTLDIRSFLLFLLLVFPAVATAADTVRVEQGLLSGESTEDGVSQVFRGIPFAAPPVGRLRWRPPAPAASWEGVREATDFGLRCIQPSRGRGGAPEMSENCLYLNIWAKKDAETDPVMVWIHGGGFRTGAGSNAGYNGEAFARRDVVLVTINYRLGAFGFFAHPGLSAESRQRISGNQGILDMVAALEWVQTNIAAFGGDAGNVTIFGESAGGTAVNVLGVTPAAEGLFHKAIAESPWFGPTNVGLLRSAHGNPSLEDQGLAVAEKLLGEQYKHEMAALRARTAEDIQEATSTGFDLAVAVEGEVLAGHPIELYHQGRHHDVPMIIGSNADEGTMFARRLPFTTPEEYRTARQEEFGAEAAAFLAVYPATTDEEVRAMATAYIGDAWFVSPVRAMVQGMDKVSSSGWQYHFTRRNQQRPEMGAHHAMEIGYVFNTRDPDTMAPEDERLADAMIRYWVQFATTGDPNVDGLPHWPAYESSTDRYLELGVEIAARSGLRTKESDLVDRLQEAARRIGQGHAALSSP